MSSDWCSEISDHIEINKLAIPGTHDAAAWTHNSGYWSTTPGTWAQRKSITEQLDLGVRVLDLRVGYASNNWTIGISSFIGMFHGPIYLGSTLSDLLTEVNTWLVDHHPDEFVILIFQQQGKKGQRDVSSAVHDLVCDTFGNAFHTFNPRWWRWPTVDELRGKVLVMGRLRSNVDGFCDVRSWVDIGDNTDGVLIDAGTRLKLLLQDRYKELSGKGGIIRYTTHTGGYSSPAQDNKKKFAKVKAAARMVPNISPRRLLRINHMSYSNLRFQPWELGEGVNTLLRNSNLRFNGVLMIDDADQDTVDRILEENDQYLK